MHVLQKFMQKCMHAPISSAMGWCLVLAWASYLEWLNLLKPRLRLGPGWNPWPRGRGDAFSRTFQTLAHLYVLSQTGNHGQQSGISISYSSMVFQCSPVSCVTLFCHTLHLFLYVFDFNNYIAWIKTSSIISCSYFILFLLELFISANIFFLSLWVEWFVGFSSVIPFAFPSCKMDKINLFIHLSSVQ